MCLIPARPKVNTFLGGLIESLVSAMGSCTKTLITPPEYSPFQFDVTCTSSNYQDTLSILPFNLDTRKWEPQQKYIPYADVPLYYPMFVSPCWMYLLKQVAACAAFSDERITFQVTITQHFVVVNISDYCVEIESQLEVAQPGTNVRALETIHTIDIQPGVDHVNLWTYEWIIPRNPDQPPEFCGT